MKIRRIDVRWVLGLVGMALWLGVMTGPAAESPVRGTDELFWVPTLEQALDMAEATGKPIFVMGYSLVGDGTTYTKVGADYCKGVF